MAILHRLLRNGAFVAGDSESGVTSYAYPTSEGATRAASRNLRRQLRAPAVAREMMQRENDVASAALRTAYGSHHLAQAIADYDAANWALLLATGVP